MRCIHYIFISLLLFLFFADDAYAQACNASPPPAENAPGLYINEIYNEGSNEYVELVVVGAPTCDDNCLNINGWIIDDNSGILSNCVGDCGMQGIAGEHMIFQNGQWGCVPYGSIIVIYQGSAPFTDDPSDSDGDFVYVLEWNNSAYFDYSTNLTPQSGTGISNYSAAAYGDNPTSFLDDSNPLAMSNGSDGFGVFPPMSSTPFHSMGWGNVTANVTCDIGGNDISFTNSSDNDITDCANFSPLAPSGGQPNSPENQEWIESMQPEALYLNLAETSLDPGCSNDDGSIEIIIPADMNLTDYNFSWTPSSYSGNSLTGLPEGTYSVTVCNLLTGCDTLINIDLMAPGCCPTFTAAPADVMVTESVCSSGCTPDGGMITDSDDCPTGSTKMYSTDGGSTWSSTVPTYDQNVAMTITVRCDCDSDNTVFSSTSSVTTDPGSCTPPTGSSVSDSQCPEPGGGFAIFDLESLLTGIDPSYIVTYYENDQSTVISDPSMYQTSVDETVYYRITDSNGCMSDFISIDLTVLTIPTINSTQIQICDLFSVDLPSFNDQINVIDDVYWYNGDPNDGGVQLIGFPTSLSGVDLWVEVSNGTCSNTADITFSLSNIQVQSSSVTCSDNGTPNDPSDDTYSITVNITGASGTWTTLIPTAVTGAYNTDVIISGFEIAGGDATLVFTDDNNPFCTVTETFTAPPACSNACNISAFPTNILCDDNGTPLDASDDTFTFDLTVTGTNTGSGWTADNGSSGIYGVATSVGPFPISGVNPTLIITDNNDNTCTLNLSVIAPPTCSNGCSISALATNVLCDDNGTPLDASDDTYTFDVTVTGLNTGGGWTADNGSSGIYGTATSVGPLPISGGNTTLVITDDSDITCVTTLDVTAPPTCSNECSISAQATNVLCDDNGTPLDASDDTYTFDVTVTGSNTGSGWTADNGSSGTYGVATTVGPLPISGGDITLIITDDSDNACTTTLIVTAPPTCSNTCSLSALAGSILCDDNGTPLDASDDTFTFNVTVTGSNTGSGWTADNGSSGIYGTATTVGPLPISGGSVVLVIADDNNNTCTTTLNVTAPPTCSNTCSISATAANIVCDDSGTPLDASDDTFTFNLTVAGSNTGTGWTADNGSSGTYGTAISVGPLPISGGDITLVITDDSDNTCATTINVIAPLTCSNTCSISATFADVLCNDNNTPQDASDDTFTFDVTVTGSNNGATWNGSDGSSGSYGTVVNIGPFSITGGAESITFTDAADPTCTTTINVPHPPACSDNCTLSTSASNFTCNNNGTPDDTSDDTWTFDLLVNGSNTSSGWTASDPAGSTGNYGQTYTFGPYSISTAINFMVTDNLNSACTSPVIINEPPSCDCPLPASVDIIADKVKFCEGDSIRLEAILTNVSNGTWVSSWPGTLTTTDDLVTYFKGESGMAGFYTITFITEDPDGTDEPCLPAEAIIMVEMIAAPSVNVISTQQICGNVESINLTDLDFIISDDAITWYEDEGLTIISDPSDFSNIPNTDFTLYAQADNGDCTSDYLPVLFDVIEEVDINTPASTSVCDGNAAIDLTSFESILSSNAGYILWFDQQNASTEITSPSNYLITPGATSVTIYFQAGIGACKSDFIPFEITVDENVAINFSEETCDPTFTFNIGNNIFDMDRASGQVTVEGVNGDCDTIYTVDIDYLPVEVIDVSEIICDDSYSLVIAGTTFDVNNSSGVAIAPGSNGECDTTYNVSLDYQTPAFSVEGNSVCPGEALTITVNSLSGGDVDFDLMVSGTSYSLNSADLPSMITVDNPSGNFEIIYNSTCPPITGTYSVDVVDELLWEAGLIDDLLVAEMSDVDYDRLDDFYWSPENLVNCDTCLSTMYQELSVDQLFTAHIRYAAVCTDTQQVWVRVPEKVRFNYDFPNVIDPTSSSGNNEFYVFIPENSTDRVVEMLIYDRWGNKLFTSEDEETLSNKGGWDGRYGDGDLVQPGVYVFLIKIRSEDGAISVFSGDISIVR